MLLFYHILLNLCRHYLEESGVAGASTVAVEGVNSYFSVGAAGDYQASAALKVAAGTMTDEGDVFQYTVSLEDGSSFSVNLTLAKDEDGNLAKLKADDGTTYDLAKAGQVKVADLSPAILSELQKTNLSNDYVITTVADGQYKFTAKEVGTNTPAVAAIDTATTTAATGVRTPATLGVTVNTSALDVGYEIKASDIKLYDGENYDDAVFTINGKKFVMLTYEKDAASTDYMNATKGLGDDVTVLVAQDATNRGLSSGDANFAQNIAKIKEVTGLNVTAGVDESTYSSYTDSGATPTDGIRLSAGKGNLTGGLTLQIGDTSDSFNQLRVGIKDMHTTSLGIDGIDISTQKGAQAAVDVVKKAINTVSEVRGRLGAISNRLDHTTNNLSVMKENITDAESAIRDTDIAEEMMSYTKNNILVQSAQAMLAQANQVPQGVLQLLQ